LHGKTSLDIRVDDAFKITIKCMQIVAFVFAAQAICKDSFRCCLGSKLCQTARHCSYNRAGACDYVAALLATVIK
jgi:hypothetical protein